MVTSAMSAFAAEETALTFDLSSQEIQEVSFTTQDGEQVTIGCETMEVPSTRAVTKPLDGGSIVHVWLDGPVSCEFYMDVSTDYKVTDAYDEGYSSFAVNVTSDVLTHTSTYAKYTLKFETPIEAVLTKSGYLKAAVSKGKLTLSETIYGLNNFS